MDEPVLEIPSRLQPKYPEEKVQVPVSLAAEREYTPEQVNRLKDHLGLIQIDGNRLQALHDLGAAGEQLGALRIQKGAMLVGIDAITQMIGKATQIVEDVMVPFADRKEMIKTVGYLGEKLAKMTTANVKNDREVVQTVMEVAQKRQNSFQPGQRVIMADPTPTTS